MERIFTLTPTPTAVLDHTLCFTAVSQSYEQLFKTDFDHLDGKKFFDVILDVLDSTNYRIVKQLVQDAISTRKELKTDPLLGSVLPGHWRLQAIPIFDEDELLYVVVEGQDATAEVEQAIAHQAKLEAAETYRVLVSTLRDYAIFMLDPTGCISTWNAGATILKQYSQEDIIGQHFSIFYSEEDKRVRKPDKELELALRDGKVEDEGWRVRKDGTRFWANVIIAPVYRDGVLKGFSKVTRDLTERKAGEARLISAYEEASRLKSDFLANMSHEIRTPMHGMLSALSLLIDTGLSQEQKELADIIDESGAILLQVINDILDYSKLTSGSFSITTKEVMNITEIVAAVRRCCKFGPASGPRFEIELDPRLPKFAQGDPLRYRQILQNLVSNAVKFTEDGYIRIKIILTHEDETSYSIRTEVIDTGIGVPPESENFLFIPFTQLDNFSTKRYKGTGLGLSICKSLAELMGGTVGFAKNEDSQGSNFYFTVTVGKIEITAPVPLAIFTADLDIKELAPNKHLLLVEDNAINQTIMVRLLRGFGFEKVDVACDGADGLRLVKQKPLAYSLILMDISMPVMDGVTATRQIRASGSSIPIIAMTANALKGDEEAYLAEGMNDYIAKPVDRRLLMQALLRWLR
jgi:osomolarity two-component system sensor histidine kinase TcsA